MLLNYFYLFLAPIFFFFLHSEMTEKNKKDAGQNKSVDGKAGRNVTRFTITTVYLMSDHLLCTCVISTIVPRSAPGKHRQQPLLATEILSPLFHFVFSCFSFVPVCATTLPLCYFRGTPFRPYFHFVISFASCLHNHLLPLFFPRPLPPFSSWRASTAPLPATRGGTCWSFCRG